MKLAYTLCCSVLQTQGATAKQPHTCMAGAMQEHSRHQEEGADR